MELYGVPRDAARPHVLGLWLFAGASVVEAMPRGGDDPTGPTGGCVRRWGLITGSGAEPRRKLLAF